MRRMRCSKIVATLGPATSSFEKIEALFLKGVDLFRLNFSHGTHEEHRFFLESIRRVEKIYDYPIPIMADLQGPKFRIGVFLEDSIFLKKGQQFRFDLDPTPGTHERVCLPHYEIFQAVIPGSHLLLNDGRIRVSVLSKTESDILVQVIIAGHLSSRKGINIPDVPLKVSALTLKDKKDLEFALLQGVDWVALSFVQTVQDVEEAREIVGKRALLMTKLEKPLAIEHLDEIVRCSDGVLVARGDLGVEMPLQEVPCIQRTVINRCRFFGKPVIVATQMMESMIHSPTPTRAEVSDVATAIFEGADGVMLSAESASGEFPLEAVSMMDLIIKRTESDPLYRLDLKSNQQDPLNTVADAIASSACEVAQTVNISVIVAFSETGGTALRLARQRPRSFILSLTPSLLVARQMQIIWGVHSCIIESVDSVDDMIKVACRVALERGFVKGGDSLLAVAGIPFGSPGGTNMLRIEKMTHHQLMK